MTEFTTSFTAQCPCGATATTVNGVEQPHRCYAITAQQLRDAYADGYEAGQAAAATEDQPEPIDPMSGAIQRLRGTSCDPTTNRSLSLALNEAFRNGVKHERESHTYETPADVRVIIAGLYPPANYEHAGSQGSDNNRTWLARWYRPEMRDHQGRPVYTILGDPNAVAVGRFKASLRKFLGVSE